jgi:hypothetical protein
MPKYWMVDKFITGAYIYFFYSIGIVYIFDSCKLDWQLQIIFNAYFMQAIAKTYHCVVKNDPNYN